MAEDGGAAWQQLAAPDLGPASMPPSPSARPGRGGGRSTTWRSEAETAQGGVGIFVFL
jgi:hypothetical protein